MERERHPTCEVCGDRIGVYEPAVVFGRYEKLPRTTSLAREPLLCDDPNVSFVHQECLEDCPD